MLNRKTMIASLMMLVVSLVGAAVALSLTLGGALAQIDPTSERQTIDAVVADRFTQTAVVQQQIDLTLTVQAATIQGPTQTAAFNATVDAVFNQALTATANPFVALNAALPGLERLNTSNAGRLEAVGTLPAALTYVTRLAFSPDGQTLAAVTEKNTLSVVQVASGTILNVQQGYGDLTSAAFSPDGQWLAFAGLDGNVRLLDLATYQVTRSFTAPPVGADGEASPPIINAVAFSPDGKWLAAGTNSGTIPLWDMASGNVTQMNATELIGVHGIAFSPDSKLLASGGNDAKVKVWDVTAGMIVRLLEGRSGPMFSVAFSPDGHQIAAGSADNTAWLWSMADGSLLTSIPTGNPATSVAFSPDGSLLAVGVSNSPADQLLLFDARMDGDHAKLAGLAGTASGTFCLAFSPDGSLLAAGGDTAVLWGVRATPEVVATVAPPTPPMAPGTPLPPEVAGSPTPRPAIFPTDVVAQVDIAEAAFQHGRMFWLRPNRQIWVMVNVPPDHPGGDWYCYNDTFLDGEPETDPALVPPGDLYQPRRGFGKLWRTHPDLKAALGWATTPEFELNSAYTYLAGGYVENGAYVPGPGEHRLTTLYGDSISFFESGVRGDCLGGSWRMTK